MTTSTNDKLLSVKGLRVETSGGDEIISEISFDIASGEVLALVGESGCGKSTVALALLGYARSGSRIAGGEVILQGVDLLKLKDAELRKARGNTISYVPQDPGTRLSPRRTVGSQMTEALLIHGASKSAAEERSRELFRSVGLPDAKEFTKRYPSELSGGQQQRVLIGMALACRPSAIVLDEPTTALDTVSQARVLDLLRELAATTDVAFVYVTHDLAVVDQLANRVAIMYAGRLVELGKRTEVFESPAHPYTNMLLHSVPGLHERRALSIIDGSAAQPGHRPSGCPFRTRCPLATAECAEVMPPEEILTGDRMVRCYHSGKLSIETLNLQDLTAELETPVVLRVTDLVASYGRGASEHVVVQSISLDLHEGECLALVGESGSGKTTFGRTVAGLHSPNSGSIELFGEVLATQSKRREKHHLRELQMVFQNPDRSLNPSHSVRTILERQYKVLWGKTLSTEAMNELLRRVKLSPSALLKFPAELSGGEKQRVAIARALVAEPKVLVCDEITSALDVSVQAAILELLVELKSTGLSLLFITHNLAVVRFLAERAMVMESGQIVELGPTKKMIAAPEHSYTRQLIGSAVDLDLSRS